MGLVLQKFYADTEGLQGDEILLCGHKVEIFSRDNSKLLDQYVSLCSYCVDYYVVSVAIYPRTKYSVHRDNPQNHPKGKFDTSLLPRDNCTNNKRIGSQLQQTFSR